MVSINRTLTERTFLIVMDPITEILSKYTFAEDQPVALLRESSDNIVYVVGNTEKRILRVGKKTALTEVAFEHEVLERLKNNSVPVPAWVLTKSGDVCAQTIDGRVAVVFGNVRGYHASFDSEYTTSDHAFSAGRTLGLIARSGENFVPRHSRTRTVYSELERALTHEKEISTNLEGGAQFIKEVRSIIELTKQCVTPEGLLHNDYRPGNVFFSDQENISGVIDFDWSCMGPLIKDVAHGAMEWSFQDGESEPNQETFNSFISGYNSSAKHPFTDQVEIYLWAMQAALADTATFFCDRLNTDSSIRRISSSFMYRKYLYFSNRYNQ